MSSADRAEGRSPDNLVEVEQLDFLVRLQTDPAMLPTPVRRALANTELLFMGYSLADWTFRVLFRAIRKVTGAQRAHVAVQLRRPGPEELYLESYMQELLGKASVFWGSAEAFARELRGRLAGEGGTLSTG